MPEMQKTWVDPWVGNITGGGHGNPLQYPSLENPHGQRSLAGCSPWESDTTERVGTAHSTQHGTSKNNDSLLLPFLNMKYFVSKYYWVQLAHFYNIFMFTRQFVYNILSAFLVEKKKLIIFIFLAYFTLGGGRGDRDGEYT